MQPSTGERPSVAVVEKLAATTGIDPFEVGPLHDSLDTDALNALLEGAGQDVTVEFTHDGYRIRVDGASNVDVRSVGPESNCTRSVCSD